MAGHARIGKAPATGPDEHREPSRDLIEEHFGKACEDSASPILLCWFVDCDIDGRYAPKYRTVDLYLDYFDGYMRCLHGQSQYCFAHLSDWERLVQVGTAAGSPRAC